MNRIGEQVRLLRSKKGLTPKALGKKIGVSDSFILEVESGRRIVNEALLGRLSKALEANLNEAGSFYAPEAQTPPAPEPAAAKVVKRSEPALPQWEQAFTQVLADVPIYEGTMTRIVGSKKAVLENRRVDGIPADKAFYYRVDTDAYASLRLKKGDLVLLRQTGETSEAGLFLCRRGAAVRIALIKPVDNKLLVMDHGSLAAETVLPKDIELLGRCVKGEITL